MKLKITMEIRPDSGNKYLSISNTIEYLSEFRCPFGIARDVCDKMLCKLEKTGVVEEWNQ